MGKVARILSRKSEVSKALVVKRKHVPKLMKAKVGHYRKLRDRQFKRFKVKISKRNKFPH